ncbi:MAG: DUF4432 family protein [Streptosporangiales bacterium]|nr:DUF4432 family protein [Streptosporangiales bacterium]
MITLDNGLLTVRVAPERGAEIRFLGAPGGPNLLFHQPTATPLRESNSTGYGSTEGDWLSEYRGGWQELFPNAGAPCQVQGVPLPFHGEASSARWEVVEADATTAVLRTPARLPLVLERRMRLDAERAVLTVEETVTNESALTVPYVWGHHPAFDAVEGARLDLPGATARVPADYDPPLNDLRPDTTSPWPLVAAKAGGEIDLRAVPGGPRERVVYLTDLAAGWAALRRPGDGCGVALAWDLATFPHAWLWTEIGGPDFPWYGRSRIVALEPASSWPNDGLAAAIERGRHHRLGPHERHSTWLTVSLFGADTRPVTHVDRDGGVDVHNPEE